MDTMQQLVLQYVPLANKLAYRKKRSLPSFVDIEELKSAAYLGLVEAATRFDTKYGAAFSTYAYSRISGAICDYLRELGWGKKSDSHFVSLDKHVDGEDCDLKDMLESKEERNDKEFLEVVSADLDDQAEVILKMYFVEDFSMKEVGEKFGVTESRVSQLIKRYKKCIRDKYEEHELRVLLAA